MTSAVASARRLPPPQAGTDVPAGTAQVSVLVPGTPADLWKALTERDSVGQWFGDLSATLMPGGAYRLDFGDGDYFQITDVVLTPPHRLEYRWRFLGTSPQNTITWDIAAEGKLCRVTVSDAARSRNAAGVAEMIEGWTDFLQRLQDYGATGRNSRYAWRKEFDGSIELPVTPDRAVALLFSDAGQAGWMPWRTARLVAGATINMTDGGQPAHLTITAAEHPTPATLKLTVAAPEWRAPTTCLLKIEPWLQASLLIVSHNGWEAINPRDEEQAAQRNRFGTLWTQALRKAQALAAS